MSSTTPVTMKRASEAAPGAPVKRAKTDACQEAQAKQDLFTRYGTKAGQEYVDGDFVCEGFFHNGGARAYPYRILKSRRVRVANASVYCLDLVDSITARLISLRKGEEIDGEEGRDIVWTGSHQGPTYNLAVQIKNYLIGFVHTSIEINDMFSDMEDDMDLCLECAKARAKYNIGDAAAAVSAYIVQTFMAELLSFGYKKDDILDSTVVDFNKYN